MKESLRIIFLRGPFSSQKSTWFYENHYQNQVWVWKSPGVREHWKDWWERNQIYWKRSSNHPDAFWQPKHRAPEIWMVRVRRPEWFWGKSINKNYQTVLMDCSKCIQMLYDYYPETADRTICWVIDNSFWEKIADRWKAFPLLWGCQVMVRPGEEEVQTVENNVRMIGYIDKNNIVRNDLWDLSQWKMYGWENHHHQTVMTECDRVKKLPSLLTWKESIMKWI